MYRLASLRMALAGLVNAIFKADRRHGKPRSSIERMPHRDGREKTEVQKTGARNNFFVGHQRQHGCGKHQAPGQRDFVTIVTLTP